MGSIQHSTKVLCALLKANVSLVQNRVYSPGDQYSNIAPRIIVHQLSPRDQQVAIGKGANGVFSPSWKFLNFRIDVFDRRPQQVDAVAEQVEEAITCNRYYNVPTVTFKDYLGKTVTEDTNGYFLLLAFNGGTETVAVPAQNLYHRTMLLGGRWLQMSV